MSEFFGRWGGRYVPEMLIPALERLKQAYAKASEDLDFKQELGDLLKWAGRPTGLDLAQNLSEELGCKVYLKREDLLHTGAHKINNTLGQGLLAKRMGTKKIIAETGAGQHGVATATIGAKLGIPVEVFMGAEDVERQALNVKRMELLGTKVIPVYSGSKTLKDAVNEAIRYWQSDPEGIYYLLGSVVGPHPYPTIVRDFQKIIGEEARAQILEHKDKLPTALFACIGGGSNAIGLFYAFIKDKEVALYGAEAGGEGLDKRHGASITKGEEGVFHGFRTKVLQGEDGQIEEAYSISAGLDYPGIGPEHAHLAETGRAAYLPITDQEAIEGFKLLSITEGIIPAFESAHAVALASKLKGRFSPEDIIIINISGRGDKDMDSYANMKNEKIHK
jgi:tryptophan synthase beta chain